jgi:hypothetical protein
MYDMVQFSVVLNTEVNFRDLLHRYLFPKAEE